MLKYNGIKEGKRALLIREFTDNKYDLAEGQSAIEAAKFIQDNWNEFIRFLSEKTGKKIKIPSSRKSKTFTGEYDGTVESVYPSWKD